MVTVIGREARVALTARSALLGEDGLRALFPAMVLVPHPDDETLGCGGLLATAASLHLELKVAFLTDGGGSHLGSPTWPRARLVQTRRLEALLATGRLGVEATDVAFLGWPDGHPFVAGSPAFEAALLRLEILSRGLKPRSIWATWEREPHADHRATAELADALAQRLSPGRAGSAISCGVGSFPKRLRPSRCSDWNAPIQSSVGETRSAATGRKPAA